jgi:hypothetical protein
MSGLVCVFCGTSDASRHLLSGRNGAACLNCLAPAFSKVLSATGGDPVGSTRITGASRCLFCDCTVADTNVMVRRSVYQICGSCLRTAFDVAIENAQKENIYTEF